MHLTFSAFARIFVVSLSLAGGLSSIAVAASSTDTPQHLLARRFDGDRSGACVQAALIRDNALARGAYCARGDRGPGPAERMEIGSVAKTMLGFAVATLVAEGVWSLNDPVSRHLPAFQAADPKVRAITVGQLLTHRSGLPVLPPGFAPRDPADPYVDATTERVLDWLATAAVGEPGQFAYSNFGSMVLSAAVTKASGISTAEFFRRRLFAPLAMANTAAATPGGPVPVTGHAANGAAVPAWRSSPEMAGIGLVVSTMDDMVKLARAYLFPPPGETGAALAKTIEPIVDGLAWGWPLWRFDGRAIALQEGGTAGFSSLLAIDRSRMAAVVLLSDVSLSDMGGMADVALQMLGVPVPLAGPRRLTAPDAAAVDALIGEYVLAGAPFRIVRSDSGVTAQAGAGPAFELKHDSRGHYFPTTFQATLEPAPASGGRVPAFLWRQGGAALPATRAATAGAAASATSPAVTDAQIELLLGTYLLAPGFALRVFREGRQLQMQATGQQAIDAAATSPLRIEAPAYGVTLDFIRASSGAIEEVELTQAGRKMNGKRQ